MTERSDRRSFDGLVLSHAPLKYFHRSVRRYHLAELPLQLSIIFRPDIMSPIFDLLIDEKFWMRGLSEFQCTVKRALTCTECTEKSLLETLVDPHGVLLGK